MTQDINDSLMMPDADDDGGVRTPEELAELLGDASIAQQEPEKPKFQPKIPKPTTEKLEVKAEVKAEDPYTEKELLDKRIKDLERGIEVLMASRDNIMLRSASMPKVPIDWAKMQEKDVFDPNINIDVIDHSMPDYMKVEPKDSTYVLRWVHKNGIRLGTMKASGFKFCALEDIVGELNIAIEVNADGRIQFNDVYLMMMEKSAYYGILRKNWLRSVAMTDPKKAHLFAKGRVEQELNSAKPDKDIPNDKTSSGDYSRYQSDKQKMDVYAPGFEI